MNFGTAMTFVAKWEWSNRADGEYTNDPKDPGGETKYGISKRWHPSIDIKNLTLPKAFVIYKQEYWDAMNCDHLPSGMDMCVFDSTINPGIVKTLIWKKLYNSDITGFIQARRAYYLSLNNPRFQQGWLNRLNDLSKFIAINK